MGPTNRWLNYHHLQGFRVVAREGSLARAATVLRVSAQTLSEQVQQLEAMLGVGLFTRGARGMTLTDTGREVLGYAEEIHALGQGLLGAVDGVGRGVARLAVGVDESLSKVVTWDLLAPAAAAGAALLVREGAHDHLISLLDARALDLVLTESPVAPTAELRCTRLRAEPVAWFAADPLAAALTADFPRAMDGAPVLLPAPGTELRRAADDWLASTGLQPRVLGEFADTSLAKVACADGLGAMLLPRSAAGRVAARYGLREVGACEGLTQRAYAVTTARRASLPAVEAVLRGASP